MTDAPLPHPGNRQIPLRAPRRPAGAGQRHPGGGEPVFWRKRGRITWWCRLDHRYRNTPLAPGGRWPIMRQQLRDGETGRDRQGAWQAGAGTRTWPRKASKACSFPEPAGQQPPGHLRRPAATSPQCENCSVALTYHSKNSRLMCHHCGYSQPSAGSSAPSAGPRESAAGGLSAPKRCSRSWSGKFPGRRASFAWTQTPRCSAPPTRRCWTAFGHGQKPRSCWAPR